MSLQIILYVNCYPCDIHHFNTSVSVLFFERSATLKYFVCLTFILRHTCLALICLKPQNQTFLVPILHIEQYP